MHEVVGEIGSRLAIRLSHVRRRYPGPTSDVMAVDDVTLEIVRGRMTAITGPSGSGKTTLLNIIGGLDRPTHGDVCVLEQAIGDLSERELTAFRAQTVGIVFQQPHLLPGLSALENVIVAGLPWRRRRALESEAEKLLTAVGLSERTGFTPARLSAGQQQRVGVARALLGDRPLLIADEPTGNLDVATTEDLMNLLVGLCEERGLTVVVATHDPAVASYAERVVQLVGGRLTSDQRLPSAAGVELHELG